MTKFTQFLTTQEVATQLGLTVRQVQNFCKSGELNATKMGRDWLITRDSFEALLQSRKIKTS